MREITLHLNLCPDNVTDIREGVDANKKDFDTYASTKMCFSKNEKQT